MMPSWSTASSGVPLREGREEGWGRCHISGVSLSAGSPLLLPPSSTKAQRATYPDPSARKRHASTRRLSSKRNILTLRDAEDLILLGLQQRGGDGGKLHCRDGAEALDPVPDAGSRKRKLALHEVRTRYGEVHKRMEAQRAPQSPEPWGA